jgi:hypothetical protein
MGELGMAWVLIPLILVFSTVCAAKVSAAVRSSRQNGDAEDDDGASNHPGFDVLPPLPVVTRYPVETHTPGNGQPPFENPSRRSANPAPARRLSL